MKEPYQDYINSLLELYNDAQSLPLGEASSREVSLKSAKKVFLFSPHPDDEAIIGALPLRLSQELGLQIVNIGVTLGSNKERKQERKDELKQACKTLGFELLIPNTLGLDGVNLKTRSQNKKLWQENVAVIQAILESKKPDILVFPHSDDYNSTHIGVHYLLVDALTQIEDKTWKPLVIETEFWHMMNKPNLMVGITKEDEAKLVYAISAHKGEVERNPYHLMHPIRMLDNVCRGSEVIGGQGAEVKSMDFAMIYRASIWEGSELIALKQNQIFSSQDSLKILLD